MKLTKVIWMVGCIEAFAQSPVERVPLSGSKHHLTANSASGEVSLNASRMLLDCHFPSGKKGRGDLLVIHDPQSGHYLWRYSQHAQSGTSSGFLKAFQSKIDALWVEPKGIVEFYIPSSYGFVKVYTEQASSLDSAVQASIDEIQQGLAIFENNGFNRNHLELKIGGLDREFRCEPLNSFCGDQKNQVISVTKDAENWRLLLRNRYDAEVVFDQDFKWISSKQLTLPPATKSPFGLEGLPKHKEDGPPVK